VRVLKNRSRRLTTRTGVKKSYPGVRKYRSGGKYKYEGMSVKGDCGKGGNTPSTGGLVAARPLSGMRRIELPCRGAMDQNPPKNSRIEVISRLTNWAGSPEQYDFLGTASASSDEMNRVNLNR